MVAEYTRLFVKANSLKNIMGSTIKTIGLFMSSRILYCYKIFSINSDLKTFYVPNTKR